MSNELKILQDQIQDLEDTIAALKRDYDDLIYNLDDDNLSTTLLEEKAGMKASIKINADSIISKVSQTDLDTQLEDYSTIVQTAEALTTVVSKAANYDAAYRGTTAPTNLEQLWYDTNVGQNIYKYYNSVSSTWVAVNGASIYSMFTQTASGFRFKNNVAISGDLITSGTITGTDIVGGKFWGPNEESYIVSGVRSGNYADLSVYRYSPSTGVSTLAFNIYDDATIQYLKIGATSFLATSGANTYPKGNWDFSEATSVTGITAKFA